MNRKVAWLFAIVAACALLFLATLVFEERRIAKVMQAQLQGKAAELDRQLTQFAVVPRLLARNPDIINALSITDDAHLQSANVALSHAQIDSSASFAFVMNLAGTTIAASNYAAEVSFVGVNYGFRPYFKQALTGTETTFFAVGATTGEPGYFVANPVMIESEVSGVVVVKFELAGLFDSWRLNPYEWLAIDEFGVVILSTDTRYLYAPTSDLSDKDNEKIVGERKYIPSESNRFDRDGNRADELQGEYTFFINSAGKQSFFSRQTPIKVEEWGLKMIVERSHILLNVFLYLLALMSLALIVGLFYRNMRAQKHIADSEKRHALQLEHEVQQRTEELRATQQELISESNFSMLGRMSGAINHEINQPLATLRLNLASLRNIIEKPDADPSEVRQIVLDSDRTTKRIGRVITTLRNLTVQRSAEHAQVDLQRLVAEIVETVQRERPALSQSLSVRIVEPVMAITGNDILLQQAILNLLYNAFDAVIDVSTPSVQLHVEMLQDQPNVIVKVTDNGCGVSEAIVGNLFKPFVSDNTRKSGLGLGLTLVELIAKEHNGQLSYQPKYEDTKTGSIFTLTLPA